MTEYFNLETDGDRVAAVVANLLKEGAVGVFPTETVYGIGALAAHENSEALARVFELKERPRSLPLPILVPDATWLADLAPEAPEYAFVLAQAFWPGPLTLIVAVNAEAAQRYGTSPDGTIAVRCPRHPFMLEVLAAAQAPLYATSANPHGKPSPTSASELDARLAQGVDFVVDGGVSRVGVASTILDCTGPVYRMVRAGSLSEREIERALG